MVEPLASNQVIAVQVRCTAPCPLDRAAKVTGCNPVETGATPVEDLSYSQRRSSPPFELLRHANERRWVCKRAKRCDCKPHVERLRRFKSVPHRPHYRDKELLASGSRSVPVQLSTGPNRNYLSRNCRTSLVLSLSKYGTYPCSSMEEHLVPIQKAPGSSPGRGYFESRSDPTERTHTQNDTTVCG